MPLRTSATFTVLGAWSKWPTNGIQSRRKPKEHTDEHSELIDGIDRVDRRDFCKAVGVATRPEAVITRY